MTKCSNCIESFDPLTSGIVTTEKGRVIASICDGCCDGVRTAKIVIKRGDVGGFAYEQWAPIEVMTGGLTSKRAG